jgi:TonB dependent receptor-like, beta-barrel
VPERAADSGRIDRYGAIDPSDAGETHRYTLAGEWRSTTRAGLTVARAYAIDYGLDLFSNFTYFLDDPENGDQFEQKDERTVYGASASQRFLTRWFGKDVENVAGLQGRLDRVPTVGLYHTRDRERLETIRQDDVIQSSGALYFQTSVLWTPKVRTTAGLRGDLYHFDVRSDDPANTGTRTARLASPKLSLILGPWSNTEVYANWGWGFHSNDARGSVQTRDPRTGEAVDPVNPLVRARGGEVGVRTVAGGRFHSSLAVWRLDIASELVFVGDAGTTEASRPSRRLGVEWSNVYTPFAGSPSTPISAGRRRAFATTTPPATGSPGQPRMSPRPGPRSTIGVPSPPASGSGTSDRARSSRTATCARRPRPR